VKCWVRCRCAYWRPFGPTAMVAVSERRCWTRFDNAGRADRGGAGEHRGTDCIKWPRSRIRGTAHLNVMLSDLEVVGRAGPSDDKRRIVALLRVMDGHALTSAEIADRLGLPKRRVGKLLSSLVGSDCPAKYAGAVVRTEPDQCRAAPADERAP
jgi:hypothetical protein